jgi:hypothetical protein
MADRLGQIPIVSWYLFARGGSSGNESKNRDTSSHPLPVGSITTVKKAIDASKWFPVCYTHISPSASRIFQDTLTSAGQRWFPIRRSSAYCTYCTVGHSALLIFEPKCSRPVYILRLRPPCRLFRVRSRLVPPIFAYLWITRPWCLCSIVT